MRRGDEVRAQAYSPESANPQHERMDGVEGCEAAGRQDPHFRDRHPFDQCGPTSRVGRVAGRCLIDLLPEGSMPDRNKPRGTVIVRGRPSSSTQDAAMPFEKAQRKRSRTESELQSIVIRVSQNAALMQRFRSTFGSENRDLAREVSQEITRYAQELDSTVTFDEGTTIVLALLKMAGLSSDR
jgi:hypothetical protein